jgi:2-polyprenyl-3-methyl-5-hydroxy-6-metoxy-1,4-benzoquinol methylase
MKEEYLDIYPHLYRTHWWWRAREHAVKKLLLHLLGTRNDYRLLDVGCGEGLLFPILSEFGTVEGVASQLNIHRVPFDQYESPSGKYDVILMLDFLEHLETPEAALNSACRLLKPNGLLFVTVPTFDILWTSHDDINNHQRRYTTRLLSRQAEDSGFQVVHLSYFFHWVFFAKLLVRLKEFLFRRQCNNQLPSIPHQVINSILTSLSKTEFDVTQAIHLSVPFGGSAIMVARRS